MDQETINSRLRTLVSQYNMLGQRDIAAQIQQYIDSGWGSQITDQTALRTVTDILQQGGYQYGVPLAAQQSQAVQQGSDQPGGTGQAVPGNSAGSGPDKVLPGTGTATPRPGDAPGVYRPNSAETNLASSSTPTGPPLSQDPTSAATSFDPNSAIGSSLYTRSQQGDKNALDLLMIQTMRNLGLDPFSGSAAVKSIMSSLYPYLQVVMSYSGIGDPKAALDQGREYANRFSNMISTPGTFGQIRQFGQQAAANAAALPNFASLGDEDQQNLMNDILGMTTAGGNAIENKANQNRLLRDQADYGLASSNDPRIDHFLSWINGDPTRRANPAYSGIAALLGR